MKIKVKNRSSLSVGYTIPEDNISRTFAPGETKNIEQSEIEKLSYQPGGAKIIKKYLFIDDKDFVEEVANTTLEPEYWMTEDGVKTLILEESLDRFLDVLDWAPEGVIELIKSFGVTLPMTDVNKIDALKKKTGYDINAVLRHQREALEEDEASETKVETRGKRRRVAIDEFAGNDLPNYNVVNRK